MTPPTLDWTAFDRRLAECRRDLVAGFIDFLRLESVSQEPERVRACGEWLTRHMAGRGLAPRMLETGGAPAIFGERRVPGARRTLLIYCHYDTKPIPLDGWLQPSPLEPVLRDGQAEDGAPIVPFASIAPEALPAYRLYARGASDDKGPIWAHLEALDLMDAVGIAPRVNLKFIFDGEEEIGSPFFGSFTEKHRDLLAADLVLVTDGPKHASGRPTVSGGARGNLKIELVLESARRDVHSGNFVAPNAAWRLNGLLSSMATPDGTPLIEGLEEDVVLPTAAERRLMADIPMDIPALEKDLGVPMPTDLLERLMFHPTLTIRGLQSGFLGKEANTIIPHRATVLFDVRLVKNQTVDSVYRRIVEHIRGQGYAVLESPDEPLPDALRGRAVIAREIERALEGVDALILPTLAIPAPPIGEATVAVKGGREPVRNVMLRCTQPFNLSGHPAISVPCGTTPAGLPVGLQIVGRRAATPELLRLARSIESAIEHHA